MKIYSIFVMFLIIASCGSKQNKPETNENANDRLLTAVSWFQHSSEMTALYYQAFNLAKLRLDEAILANKKGKPLAVVVDIDETMLNNSPFETRRINHYDSLSGWYNWTSEAKAKALPGAMEFAKYAERKKVEIFYITNRDDNERTSTIKNLANVGFPYADEVHLLTRSDVATSTGNTSSKAGRRAKVAETHNIVLLIGDNLNDFSENFEDRSKNNGKDSVAKYSELFGKMFIVLPNPIYGAWEKPLYDYNDTLTDMDKTNLLKSKLLNE